MQKFLFIALTITAISLFLHACGGGGSGKSQMEVRPEAVTESISSLLGGSIATSNNGFVMTVGASALEEDTQITITPQNDATNAVTYTLEPDGLTFNSPAEVIIQTEQDALGTLVEANGLQMNTANTVVAPFTELASNDSNFELLTETISNLVAGSGSAGIQVNTEVSHFSSLTVRNPKATLVARSAGFSLNHTVREPFTILCDFDVMYSPTANEAIHLGAIHFSSFTSSVSGAVGQSENIAADLEQTINNPGGNQPWWGDSSIIVPLPITNHLIGNFTCEQTGTGSIQLDLDVSYQGMIGADNIPFNLNNRLSIGYQVNCTDSTPETTTTTTSAETSTTAISTTNIATTTTANNTTTTSNLSTTTLSPTTTTSNTTTTTTTPVATTSDFTGVWNGNADIGGVTKLIFNDNLQGTWFITNQNGAFQHSNISATLSSNEISFDLPVSDQDIGKPDCSNWSMTASGTISADKSTLYLYFSGIACGPTGGQYASFTDTMLKE
ncbi:MAG: hypothetical protein KJ950_10975 [Proteobacteria bacterium]|nr:hypothetical protein [Pseudomonadota bacterium]MBU1687719.1 hypothetical protein [Pseudomonadota bacterium]